MTESHLDHLDDESLSAALDGEDASAAGHLAGCAACRARGDSLDAARRAVGAAPAPAPAGLADRAVAAAMAAYAAEEATRETGDAPGGNGQVVVPLRRPAAASPDSFTSSGPAGRRPRRLPSWALGVAAALAAVLVAVPLLNRGSDDNDALVASSAADKTSESANGPVVDGGDLGDQSDQLALGSTLSGAIGGGATSPAFGAPATPAVTAQSAADAAARASDPKAVAGSPAVADGSEATPAPAAAPTPPEPSSTAAPVTADPAAIAACEAAAAKDFGDRLGPLVYRATLRWQGTPAVLLAYLVADTSSKGPDHQAFVMELDGCRVLVAQGF